MTTTALAVAQGMTLPDDVRNALRYDVHPLRRTRAFHQLFNAPVRDELPDASFSHITDERAAVRLSFILSEAIEILEKGFGIEMRMALSAPNSKLNISFAYGSDNKQIYDALMKIMDTGTERDLKEVVDGLGDLNVVVNGFAVELGVDMLAVDQEVFASNLTKLDENGQPIVADGSNPDQPAGKILKGPNFVEPQLGVLLGL